MDYKFKLIDFERALDDMEPYWFILILLAVIPLFILVAYFLISLFDWLGALAFVSATAFAVLYMNGFLFINERMKNV